MKIQLSDKFTYAKLFIFALPSVFMMIVSSVYGVVDGLFVSNFVGKIPFAAINLVMPFIMILGGMGFMLGTGGTALVSQALGENDRDKANRYFTMLVIFAVIFGAALTALGLAIIKPVSVLMGATEDMLGDCVLYGRILIGFTVFFMLQNIFQSFLAAAEKPGLGFIVTLSAGIANIALDALFIVGLGWGVAGAAAATVIGQLIGGIVPLIYFAVPNKSLLRLTKTKLQLRPILRALANGSSELLTNVATSVVSVFYNLQLIKYLKENGVSAYGVLMYVQFVFIAIEIGYTIGVAPIIGYNHGAQNNDELKNIFKKSLVVLSVAGIALSALAQALAIPLAKLFVGYDKELTDLTVYAFRLFSFSFVFSGINIFSSGFFTALGNGAVSAIISFLRALVCQIMFVFLLPALFGVNGIWWAMFAAEACAFIVSVSFFITKRKKYNYA